MHGFEERACTRQVAEEQDFDKMGGGILNSLVLNYGWKASGELKCQCGAHSIYGLFSSFWHGLLLVYQEPLLLYVSLTLTAHCLSSGSCARWAHCK